MQFAFIKGFEDIPVRFRDFCPPEGDLIRMGSQEYDRDCIECVYPFCGIDPIHSAGEMDVHEHEIGALVFQGIQR